jgi:aminoglycoside N3'-acetyltransferase
VRWGGFLLCIGVDHGTTTAQHVAEVSVPCPCIDQTGRPDKVVDESGEVREAGGLVWRNAPCPVPIARMEKSLERRKLQVRGKVGDADSILVKAADLCRVRREHLRRVCPTCKIRPAYP